MHKIFRKILKTMCYITKNKRDIRALYVVLFVLTARAPGARPKAA
jgi:hypothetical protein